MRFHKVLNGLIVAAFLAAMIVPLLTADFEGGKISADENRYLATFPQLRTGGRWTFDAAQFNNWINDNLGGRQPLREVAAELNYRMANELPGDWVEGKENWIFLLPAYEIPTATNTSAYTDESIALLSDALATITEKFNSRAIETVFAVYPQKYVVYAEYMPQELIINGGTSLYERIAYGLGQNGAIHLVAPFEQLVTAKANRLTYAKAKDASHWNNYGAFIGYQSLMQEVKAHLPKIRILQEEDFEISEEEFVTSLVGGAYTVAESDLVYTRKENSAQLDTEYLLSLGFNGSDPWRCYRYFRNQDTTLPKAVMIGDSYTWMFMLENMAQSFSELAFIHYNDISQLDLLVNQIEPDIVIGAFLGEAIFSMTEYVPDETAGRNETRAVPGMNIAEYTEWGYHYLDYCDDTLAEEGTIWVHSANTRSYMEGWALDPLAGSVAGRVIIEIGGEWFEAEYGKERDSVAEYFGNEAYLCSGYTAVLDTQKLIEAGQIAVHVIAKDGGYQYPPAYYWVEAAS